MNTTLQAVFWMCGALASFTGTAIAVREVSDELGTFQILFFRTTVALVILVLVMPRLGSVALRTRQPVTHLIRHGAHFAGQYGWFVGIASIPLAEVFALEFTAPIWAALMAPLVLGERMTAVRWLAVALGFAGALLVLRPGAQVVHPAALAVLAGAAAYSVSHTLTKKLAMVDRPATILFYMNLVQWLLASASLLWAGWQTPSLGAWPCLLSIGALALSSHYCFARAMALADATVVIPIDFLRLPLVAVLAWLIYGEGIDLLVMAGAAVMCTGIYLNVRQDVRRAQV